MSFFYPFVELLLLTVVALDTLGFVAESRKNSEKVSRRDYVRLCFTWVFFLVLNALSCTTCCGYFGSIFRFLFFGAKVFVSVPAIGGTETLYTLLVEQNVMKRYLLDAYNLFKAKSGCCQ